MEKEKLSPKEIMEIINNNRNHLVVDVRTYNEYKTNHFISAINIPFLNIDSIRNIAVYKNTYIFLYCSSGLISEDAKDKLRNMGYFNAYNMGGIYHYTQYLYIE